MTYPPQQPPPGPDPYGQPPDPYGQQQWGAPQPGGFPVGPPPRKPRTGLISALIIGAIVVVGGGGAGAYVLLSKEDDGGSQDPSATASDPKAVAEKFATEFETVLNADPARVSLEPLKPLLCSGDLESLRGEVEDQTKKDAPTDSDPTTSEQEESSDDAEVTVDDFTSEGDKATFTLAVGYPERDITEDATMAKADGGWQVCGLYDSQDGDSGGGSTGSSGNEPPPNPIPTG